ncbi:MAG: MIP/aquaporin family protein [Actinomycetota bacterium]
MFLGEVVGTAVLVLIGCGGGAGVLLARSKSQGAGWIVTSFGWGMGLLFGILASQRIPDSVAHLNPAVSIAFAFGGINGVQWSDVPTLVLGQFVGAILGAVVVWATYLPHFAETSDASAKLAVFATGPQIRRTVPNLVAEAVGTAVLVIGIIAVLASPGAAPLAFFFIGLLLFAICIALGGPTGNAVNPARDLGPRLAYAFLPIAGSGDPDWRYAWIPVVGPIVGGVLAVVLLQALGVL